MQNRPKELNASILRFEASTTMLQSALEMSVRAFASARRIDGTHGQVGKAGACFSYHGEDNATPCFYGVLDVRMFRLRS
jgi:hypothetical protein